MTKNLVIVESPAKAKTIEKYLGRSYTVKASMGHLRDLPKSKIGIDIENDFEPQYIPVKDKSKLISELKKDVKEAETVYLATDPDREGEAISWHLKELLSLPDEKAKRVTFNEITKKVVTESIKNPRDIDINLVDAQQARRVLDRIVGYELSPYLWKTLKSGLSAGRVQSVATRMVVDREKEIRDFKSEEYWLLDAVLDKNGEKFTARFYGVDGNKKELKSEKDVNEIVSAVSGSDFTVSALEKKERSRKPAAPFITSTLQQEASRRINMTPRRTMTIAQQLYEGVEITGHGTIGLITYMRTDSLRLSEEALAAAKDYIIANYGTNFYPPETRRYKAKAGAQDAHEAIRPTDVTLSPDVVRRDLTNEQYRLYRIIWGRYVASQMADAVYDSLIAEINCNGVNFKASSSRVRFPGYTAVYEEPSDSEDEEGAKGLPALIKGDSLGLVSLNPSQQFTQPPVRYTEATLIRAMEEKGIGRPSTYAPTISTITAHDYVVKEGKYLKPTNTGETVTAVLLKNFTDIVDLDFTKRMESELDEVENGSIPWKNIIREFYAEFEEDFKNADTEKIKIPDELSDEVCEVCGKPLIYKNGKFGRFLACQGFPECTFTKPIVIEMPGSCPNCNGKILKRTSKKGYVFYACERGTDCGFITWDVPTANICPECGKTMFKPSGRGPLKSFCINESCINFVPEEKRKYVKKTKTDPAASKAKTTKTSKKKTGKA